MEGWTGPAETKETQDSFQERALGLKPTRERALGSKTYPHKPQVFLGAHVWWPDGGLESAADGGLDWGSADGLDGELVLDWGWTLSRHRRIVSLQLSPVVQNGKKERRLHCCSRYS